MDFFIGAIKGALELEDKWTGRIEEANKATGYFSANTIKSFGAVAGAVAAASTAIVAAAGAAATAIVVLGNRGAEIADVSDQFDVLAERAGLTSDVLLGKLREGTANTIRDFDLMRATNSALSLGLQASEQDFLKIGQASKILADRIGGDTLQAYEKITEAMAKGRTRGLQSIGIFVDQAAAVDKFRQATGKLDGALTDSEKRTAANAEVMRQLTQAIDEVGVGQADFTDLIQQGQTAIDNFRDRLSVAIATSPALMAAFREIQKAILDAFGNDTQQQIKTLTDLVNTAAVFVVNVGIAAVETGRFMVNAFYGVRVGIFAVLETVSSLAISLKETEVAGLEMARALTLPGMRSGIDEYLNKSKEALTFAKGVRDSFIETQAAALDSAGSVNASFDTARTTLDNVKKAMVAATAAADEQTDSTNKGAAAQGKFGGAVGNTIDELKANEKAILDNEKAIADFQKSIKEFEKDWDNINKLLRKGATTWEDIGNEIAKRTDAMTTGIISNYNIIKENQLAHDDAIRKSTMTTLEYRLDAVNRWTENEKLKVDTNVANWEDAFTKIQQTGSDKLQDIIVDTDEFRAAMASAAALFPGMMTPYLLEFTDHLETATDDGKTFTEGFGEGLKGLATAFSQLSQVAGGAFGGLVKTIGETVNFMNVGMEAGKTFGEGMKQAFDKSAKTGDIAQGIGSIATGLVSGFGAIMGATGSDSLKKNLFGGAATGAAVGLSIGLSIATAAGKGAAVAGPWGAAAGAIVGIMIAVFRGRAARAEMERVGEMWGTDISKGMAEKINKDSKSLFKGSKDAAELFNFSGILGEAGGLNTSNADKFLGKFRDIFVMLETGQFNAAQATTVLDENWQAFETQFTTSTGLITHGLAEIRDLANEAGLSVAAINEFVGKNIEKAATGFERFFQNAQTASDGFAENQSKLVDLQKQLADVDKERVDPRDVDALAAQIEKRDELKKKIEEVTAAMADQKAVVDALSITSETGAAAAGASLAALFAEYQESGHTVSESLEMLQPSVEGLRNQLEAAGISGGEAFDTLARLSDIAADAVAGPILDGIDGLREGLVGMNNAGLLNQDTFQGLTGQINQAFNALIAQGVSGDDALKLMQPTLQTVAQLQNEFGFQTDEATAGIIEQAREAGLLGNTYKTSADKQLEATNKLTEALDRVASGLGVSIPRAADQAAAGVERSANRMNDALGEVDYTLVGIEQGHSPGGLTKIPGLMQNAATATARSSADMVKSLSTVNNSIINLLKQMDFASDITNIRELQAELQLTVDPKEIQKIQGQISSAMKSYFATLGFGEEGEYSPAVQAQMDQLEAQIDAAKQAFEAQSDSSPLEAWQRELEDLQDAMDTIVDTRDEATNKARQAALSEMIKAEQRRLEDLKKQTDADVKNLERLIEELKQQKNPFEGYPTPPPMLDVNQAIARINEVFAHYGRGPATPAEIQAMAGAFGYDGSGAVSQARLESFLQGLVQTWMQGQITGFRGGSGGVQDFGQDGSIAILHGRERVQTEQQMIAERSALRMGTGSGGNSALQQMMSTMLAENRELVRQIVKDGRKGAIA